MPSHAESQDAGKILTASVTELSEASADTALREIQTRVHRFDWFPHLRRNQQASVLGILPWY
jgi:hypothetical protein